MEDQEVIDRINGLANEELQLFGKESRGQRPPRTRSA